MKYSFFPHILIAIGCLCAIQCAQTNTSTETGPEEESIISSRQEAREDSLELVAAYARQAQIEHSVQASVETDAIASDSSMDAADDPAIWVNSSDPSQSIIIGSNKKGGLHLYALTGEELAYFPVGNINNVDVIDEFRLGEESIILVGGSNRSDQSIDLYQLDPTGPTLTDVSADALLVDSAEIDDIYGFCLYQNQAGSSYAFINGKNGRVQQFKLQATKENQIRAVKVRDLSFASQVEGMVADAQYGWLYVGEEDQGVWKLPAEPDGGDIPTLIEMSTERNQYISYDIEGLTLYETGEEGYLIASSQGNFSYAVFERMGDNAYLGSFTIQTSDSVDGVEETDGIEAISSSLGPDFPNGVFLAQDGFNHEGNQLKAQNFKLVDWRQIEAVIR